MRIVRVLVLLALGSSTAFADGLDRAVHDYLLLAAGKPPPKAKRWELTGTVGFVTTTGNSDDTTFNMQLGLEHEFEKNVSLKVSTFSIFSKSDGEESANQHILVERLQKELNDKEAVWQQLQLEYDSSEELSLRAILTVGYRRKLVDRKDFVLHGDAGVGFMYEEFFGGDNDTTAIAQFGVEYVWQLTKNLEYRQVITFFPSVSDLGEFRMYWLSEFTVPLSGKVSGKLTILDQFDSDPQAGVDENDLTITFGLEFRL